MVNIKTTKGDVIVDAIEIEGMKRAPIVLAAIPNNGGGTSYSITHKPTGIALIRAKTEDKDLVVLCARKLWAGLDNECREALRSDTFGSDSPEFNRVGAKVANIKDYMNEKIAARIRREVKEELK